MPLVFSSSEKKIVDFDLISSFNALNNRSSIAIIFLKFNDFVLSHYFLI